MSRPPLSLQGRAIAWLAQREQSRNELRRKLLALVARQQAEACEPGAEAVSPVASAEDIDALLDGLAAQGLLSAERFTESRINVRAPRYGNLRIRQELSRHGVTIDPDTAQALQASELDRARAVWAKRYGELATDPAERARQARFLTARGFSPDVVRRVVAGRAEP